MATTYEKIASVTVGSGGAASIDFTSIPATFDDLIILSSLRSDRASPDTEDTGKVTFNGSSSNFTFRWLRGDGANTSSGSGSTNVWYLYQNAGGTTSNTFTNASLYIPNYATSNNKSFSLDTTSENNATTAWAALLAGLWSNSAAISSVAISPNVGTNWVQHSTAVLYGIKKS